MEANTIRALLIDDDQGDYEMTRAIASQIEDPPVQLDWVSTFEEGRDAFEAGEHDIYIVDYFLEDLTGPKAGSQVIVLLDDLSEEPEG